MTKYGVHAMNHNEMVIRAICNLQIRLTVAQ